LVAGGSPIASAISRVMTAVAPREQLDGARRARALLSKLSKARDLIQLGAYQPGHDHELDLAVRLQPQLMALLQQDMHDRAPLDMSRSQLCRLVGT
jgi:flagellum-specific ATP synthase